jgi:hypothetical protein
MANPDKKALYPYRRNYEPLLIGWVFPLLGMSLPERIFPLMYVLCLVLVVQLVLDSS